MRSATSTGMKRALQTRGRRRVHSYRTRAGVWIGARQGQAYEKGRELRGTQDTHENVKASRQLGCLEPLQDIGVELCDPPPDLPQLAPWRRSRDKLCDLAQSRQSGP